MKYAPIALFVYNRPSHTRHTIEALIENTIAQESYLYIFSDAPKNKAARKAVDEVRSYIDKVVGFARVTIIKRTANFGLSNSIIDGVTMLCEEFGRVIVIEDDLVTSPNFLTYMNDALDIYANEPRVMQISGYMFPINRSDLGEAFLMKFTTTWGWGVWKRSWGFFEESPSIFLNLKNDLNLRRKFDLDNSASYYKMLQNQMAGSIDSWGVRWYASVFNRDGLTLFPAQSLVRNIGNDDSGVHSCKTDIYEVDIRLERLIDFPSIIEEHPYARERIVEFYRRTRPSFITFVIRAFRKIFIRKIRKIFV